MDNRYNNYRPLLHETAHAVHFLSLDPQNTALNMGVSNVIAEGFANFVGDFIYHPHFASFFFGTENSAALLQLQQKRALNGYFQLEAIEAALFDQALYLNKVQSLQDLNELKFSLEKDILGRKPYSEEPCWGHLIHHTTHPIYLHNYFLGDMFTAAMKQSFAFKHHQSWDQDLKAFGQAWNREVLQTSGLYRFEELYERVADESINLEAYLDALFQTH